MTIALWMKILLGLSPDVSKFDHYDFYYNLEQDVTETC
jgi:hypothetical protein